jgi:hypothetical protein
MLHDIPGRSTRSRLLTPGFVAVAIGALLPLRLVARPSPAQVSVAAAPVVVGDLRRESSGPQSQNAQPTDKSGPLRDSKRPVRFVLLSEDGSRTSSNADDSDVERAERQRKNREALLWFQVDDKEYVSRDPDVLREARALWTDVSHGMPLAGDALRELTDSIASLDVDGLAQQAMLLAQSVAGSGIANHAQAMAEHGSRAAEAGLMVADDALRALSHGGLTMFPFDAAKLDEHLQHLHSIDMSALDQHARALEESAEHLGKQIEHDMRNLEQHLNRDLDERMKDLDDHLRDLDFDHLSDFGRSVNDAAGHASEEMRALMERAIRNGQAKVVR